MNEPIQSEMLTIQHVSKILLSCINDEAAPVEDLAQRVVDWANAKERELNQWKECADELLDSIYHPTLSAKAILRYNQLKQGEGK